MRRQVELIGAAWGLGGVDPGCAEAPSVLAPRVQVQLRGAQEERVAGEGLPRVDDFGEQQDRDRAEHRHVDLGVMRRGPGRSVPQDGSDGVQRRPAA